MEVDLTPKEGHSLQLPHQMKDDHLILERHAHLEIHRLAHEKLLYGKHGILKKT